MKRCFILMLAVLICICAFILASCSKNETAPAVPVLSSEVSEDDNSIGDADYMSWTYSDWSAANDEEKQKCVEAYAIKLLTESGQPTEMEQEELDEISQYLNAAIEIKLITNKEATLEELIDETLELLSE